MGKIRFIALYLPQFHPIKENDEVWGKGFTEWTNVASAKPLFRNHYQPHIPADLGFYDLRLEETRVDQANLARQYGIEGFCYWYYWFGNGDKILHRPIMEVLESGKPDYPFCLAWANHSWTTSTWIKQSLSSSCIIKEQKYLGEEDYVRFFYDVLPAFKDSRYINVDGKPLFLIHNAEAIPDVQLLLSTWKKLSIKNGLKGVYFIASSNGISYSSIRNGKKTYNLPSIKQTSEIYNNLFKLGFDAVNSQNKERALIQKESSLVNFLKLSVNLRTSFSILDKHRQKDFNKYLLSDFDKLENVFPSVYSNWDRSPRSGRSATILTESTPAVFKEILQQTSRYIMNKSDEHKIVFLRSWNEWGEGNHIEPDKKYGRGYLESIKSVQEDFKKIMDSQL